MANVPGQQHQGERPLDVPKELWQLVNKLVEEARNVEDLFERPGLHTEAQLIRDALDTGQLRYLD